MVRTEKTLAAAKLSLFYAAIFLAVGVHLPFWPLWLADRGLTPSDIGLIMAAPYLIKLAVNPLVGHQVDKSGDRRRPMALLALGATASFALFPLAYDFWSILALTCLAFGFWSGIMPVGESLAMLTAHRHGLDYGRMRLWGSAAFILGAGAVGRLLVDVEPWVLVWLVVGALGVTTLACFGLPDERSDAPAGPALPIGPLAASAPFLLFLIAAGFNQTSHTVYYAFATLHWKQAGIEGDVIGLLWSEGVVAEILLFAFAGPAVRRLGPARLIMLAGLGGVVRWLILGSTTEIGWLVGAQLLHAATFGAAHLGAMHFITAHAPPGLSARAQGLHSSVAFGLVPGLMTPLTGRLFETLGGGAFLVMALASTITFLAAWALARRK